MKEKVLNIINSINKDLVSSESLSPIIIKDNKISFAIDVGILNIDPKEADELSKKIKEEIAKISDDKVNIIFTKTRGEEVCVRPSKQEDKPQKQSSVKGVKNVIVIASGKGGVGKSTVAVNLAISLKRIGYKIGIVDADIYGPSITYLMNLKGKPDSENGLMIPINNYGIDAISVGSIVDSSKASVWRGPMITKVLTQLISGTKWEDIDYLIVDLPPGTGDVHLSLIQQFKPDGAILVSTPNNLSIIDVVKGVDMFKTLQVPILGVIQNMAYLEDEAGNKNYIFGKDLVKKMADDMSLSFLGDIPIDPKINQTNNDQSPICYSDPSSKIAFRFGEIAEDVVDKVGSQKS